MNTPPFLLDGPEGPVKPRADFRIPEGYFDALPQRVLAVIEQESLAKGTKPSGFWAWRLVLEGTTVAQRWALAASVVLVVGWFGVWQLRSGGKDSDGDPLLAQLTAAEITENLDLHGWPTGHVLETTDERVWGDPVWIHAEDLSALDSLELETSTVNWNDVEMTEL
jgi:hypothetical protein